MRKASVVVFALATMFSGITWAANPSCTAAATEKKLAGSAKNSFLKKCEKDAKAACEVTAADKKLAGAAKASFTKKCTKDAVGS
ncbi:hypothetical protein FYM52_02455 [Comamonas sp. CAH-2]|jgi:hypothetical protein|uniref:hypothetical protein n=1 Tax=Comamonas sp. CAH-2 TaxID=2605745 RepID=UPI0012AE0D2C|nr:hypothetical protein [Comamonas sp. CAH-2]MRT19224.1 hypothetical protein [Comamonas sp. CAH-2]